MNLSIIVVILLVLVILVNLLSHHMISKRIESIEMFLTYIDG